MAQPTDQKFPAEEILAAVKELRFGVVEVHVHETNVTEIRQIRRTRFHRPSGPGKNSSQEDDQKS